MRLHITRQVRNDIDFSVIDQLLHKHT